MRISQTLATALLQAVAVSSQLIYADNQEPTNKDSPQVAKNFPHVDSIELLSPSFLDPDTVPAGFSNGTSGPTDQRTMDHWLQTLAARNEWMTYNVPDFKSEEGRTIPYVYLSSDNIPRCGGLSSASANSTSEKVKIWLQGGVHGNEPAGDQALLALIAKLDANATWAASVLSKADILVLPRYNPDGVAYFQRYLASSFDPNRDHTKMARQQTRDIKSLVMNFAPHVGVDMHEYTASRAYGADKQWLPSQDGQFSAMKNLNIHKNIRDLSHGLFTQRIAEAMDARSLRHSPYVTGTLETDDIVLDEATGDAKMGDTSVALSQAVMFLTETRGIQLADQHWHRRVASGLTMVEAIVQTAVDNADLVRRTVEDARTDFITNDEDIVVTDITTTTNITWPYIQAKDGKIVDVDIVFMNSTTAKANLTRARPEAYIFSSAWSDVADRLRAAGVTVDELRSGFSGTVQATRITAARVDDAKYEGVARTTDVVTETYEKEVRIPAGGYWVSTRQKNAAHVFNVLEPENIDSYVVFNILPVDVGDEYQVYRVYK